MYCHAHYRNCTPTVQRASEPLNLCTKTVALIGRCKSDSCIHPYSGCTKMRLESEFFPLCGILSSALSELYTYCMRSHRISQFVYIKLCGHPYGNVSQQAVQIPTVYVAKCHLHQSCELGVVYCNAHYTDPYSSCTKMPFGLEHSLRVVYCHAHYQNCTPTVQDATAQPSLCTKTVAPVRRHKSERCIQLYSGCTKMRLASEHAALFGLLPCALLASYTYCTRRHRISQFVYKGCVGIHTTT